MNDDERRKLERAAFAENDPEAARELLRKLRARYFELSMLDIAWLRLERHKAECQRCRAPGHSLMYVPWPRCDLRERLAKNYDYVRKLSLIAAKKTVPPASKVAPSGQTPAPMGQAPASLSFGPPSSDTGSSGTSPTT